MGLMLGTAGVDAVVGLAVRNGHPRRHGAGDDHRVVRLGGEVALHREAPHVHPGTVVHVGVAGPKRLGVALAPEDELLVVRRLGGRVVDGVVVDGLVGSATGIRDLAVHGSGEGVRDGDALAAVRALHLVIERLRRPELHRQHQHGRRHRHRRAGAGATEGHPFVGRQPGRGPQIGRRWRRQGLAARRQRHGGCVETPQRPRARPGLRQPHLGRRDMARPLAGGEQDGERGQQHGSHEDKRGGEDTDLGRHDAPPGRAGAGRIKSNGHSTDAAHDTTGPAARQRG